MKRKMIVTCALLLSSVAIAKVEVSTNIEIFSEKTKEPSAITVSPDGQKVFWIAKKSEKTKLEPIDVWYSDSTKISETKIDRPFLNLYTMASYGGDETVIIDHEYGRFIAAFKTIFNKLAKKGDEPVGYKSCVDIFNTKENKVQKKLCAKDLGLEFDELIAHARLSPDKNWLAFYIKGAKNPAGIYLYNLNTEKTAFLGEHNDKHPTWSSDGKKILFHFQKGGNVKDADETEQAYIGWYDLELNDQNLLSSNRQLLDDPNLTKEYTYQKHPALVPNSNYVIYHGQEKIDGSKKLFIRKLKVGSKAHDLAFKYQDCKIKGAKHPAIGYEDKYLYFIGKTECNDLKSEAKILRIQTKDIMDSLKKD